MRRKFSEDADIDTAHSARQPGFLRQLFSKLRRYWLVTARPEFVRKSLLLRDGECRRCGRCCAVAFACPHFVSDSCNIHGNHYRQCKAFPIDARDTRLIAGLGGEQCGFSFRAAAPKAVPLAVHGVRAMLIALVLSVAAAVGAFFWVGWWALVLLTPALFVAYFFRDPERFAEDLPPGAVLAPADGKVVAVSDTRMPIAGGPALMIDIFLSVFSVHINRSPVAGKVADLRYERGKFLNALKSHAARENENNVIAIDTADGRHLELKQISGAIARRIVCTVKPGDTLLAGERVGMIKFGSRTQLFLPSEAVLRVSVQPGSRVKAGQTILGYLE